MRRAATKRFLFRLALMLGKANPYAMARGMSSRLLQEWEAYAAIEPFDGVRADYNMAHIVQMLYNINRDAKKEPHGRPLGDFLIKWDAEEETPEDRAKKLDEKLRIQTLTMRAMAEAMGGGAQPPARVVEHAYPVVVGAQVSDAERQVLAKAQAALERTQ